MISLEEVKSLHAKFNLFSGFDPQGILSELNAEPTKGPLDGSVIGLKANIACCKAAWNAGLAHRSGDYADVDANVTARLRSAGARVLPGLNMDAAALGGTTENPVFGATLNPLAKELSTGGSSGGSAAAVAAGLVQVALGTDTLGSIRIPASWCGVHGLKPTFGAIGRSGITPLAPSLDTVGPLAATASDLWLMMQVLAGEDRSDLDSRSLPIGWLHQEPVDDLSGIRIGVRQDDDVLCTPEFQQVLSYATKIFTAAGATIVPVSMPSWRSGSLRKAAFLLIECEGAVVYSDALSAGDQLHEPVQSLLRYGKDVSAGKLVEALSEIRRAKAQLVRSFAEVDLLLTPTTPQNAVRLGKAAPDNQADYTALASVCGVPALASPMPLPGSKLPASVQLIGPDWSEPLLIGASLVLGTYHGGA